MCTHIAKSLQVCCKIIKCATDAYNIAAAELNPPRQCVDWAKLFLYSFLEEFALLQDIRNNVSDKLWAKPVTQAAIKVYDRAQHAREEISWLNLKVRHFYTSIRDEHVLFANALGTLSTSDPVRGALQDFVDRRQVMHCHLLLRILQVYALPGFSGIRSPGMREGGSPTANSPLATLPLIDIDAEDNKQDDSNGEAVEESAHDAAGTIEEYIADLGSLRRR